jgi:photosystem II stability/assembly factor-like uncharacterized protein
MKRLVLFAVCAIAATAAAAEWHYLSGGKLSGISSVGSHVWAVGQDGLFFYSEDNGGYWRRLPRFTTRNLVDVEFWDQSLGFVTAEGGFVYRTTDDGTSWDSTNVPHGGNRLRWLSGKTVYIAAAESSFFVRSSDAGQTWQVSDFPVRAPWFLDSLQGWGAGIPPGVMRTRDGGATWVRLCDLDYTVAPLAFGFHDTLAGICGYHYYMDWGPHGPVESWYAWFATGDGGQTWTWFVDGSAPPTRCSDVDAHGRVYGLDAGRCVRDDWSGPVGFGKWQSFNDFSVSRGNYPWICGAGGAIRFSTNGGLEWQSARLPSVGSTLTNVEFADSEDGWGAGYGGMVVRTTDAGRSWSDVSVPVSSGNPYTNITVIDDTTVVCCMGYSYYNSNFYHWEGYFAALRTSNAGTSWDTMQYIYESSGPYAIGSSRIARCGDHLWHPGLRAPDGNSLRSTDGGATWLDMDTLGDVSGNQEPFDISFADTLHGWAIDSRKNIRVTTNSGDSWTITATGLNVKRLKMTSPTTGWAISDSELFKTTDGGVTWDGGVVRSGLQAIAFCDSMHGTIVGKKGLILRTSDGGQTWAWDASEFTSDLYDVFMLDSTHAWAVGQYGLVLGFGDWAIGVDEARGNEGPHAMTAAVAVRPNPCRDRAKVEFSSPLSKSTQMKLVDAAGRVMQVISVRAGARSLELDMRGAPSGIYFLRAGSSLAARLVVQH